MLLLVAVVGAWGFLRASLPRLEGESTVAGLGAPVTVERDSLGVVRIVAQTRADAARALGFVHAQERFFQMDLLRRAGAGELAALLGADLVPVDSMLRPHRFRMHAREVLARLPRADRVVLDAYVAGVNAGLESLGARPFEYAVLREAPEPWRPEDTFLVGYAMFIDLQRGGMPFELEMSADEQFLPPALHRFLDPRGDAADAPLMGGPYEAPGIPPADSLGSYRPAPIGETLTAQVGSASTELNAGSNNFAVAGVRTATGAALVANDMHLGLRLPNIWFRASMEIAGPRGPRRVAGLTLPGTPTMIAGTNGDVAWGLTNAYGDYVDLVRLVPGGPGLVRTATGTVRLDTLRETILIAHGASREIEIVQSPWGPVLYADSSGNKYAMQWAAHRPEAVDLGLLALEHARTVAEALDAVNRAGIPAQNVVVGDRQGHVGWTIGGRLPLRVGHNGQTPVLSTDPDALWRGLRDPAETPRVVDPENGQVWSANNRVAAGEALRIVGLGPYDHGTRAGMIRDDLLRLTHPATEADLLAVQLDDRGVLLAPWQRLLLATLDPDALRGRPDRARLRARVEAWGARASVASPGYGPVKAFHDTLNDVLMASLLAPVRAVYPTANDLKESALWDLATEQPAALLPPGAGSWRALLLACADSAALAEPSWGEDNRADIAHPMADALPLVGRFLRMPADPLPGDAPMPRVQRSNFGASERFVVSPGHEEQGILHMPGGQAGHPLSPYWGAGHDAWVEGRPLLFLPGRARWTLRLIPGSP